MRMLVDFKWVCLHLRSRLEFQRREEAVELIRMTQQTRKRFLQRRKTSRSLSIKWDDVHIDVHAELVRLIYELVFPCASRGFILCISMEVPHNSQTQSAPH